ncbi:DBH-like monooxygenase protein 1, partial [Exaiptasia diaphana]
RSLLLLNILTKKPNLPNDLKDFEFRVNINVSSKNTLYYCKPFQMPDFNDTKKHVVKISPVITPGNEGLVHHILVYGCKDDFPVSNLSVEGACFGSNMPDHVQSCAAQSVVASWAIGGGTAPTSLAFVSTILHLYANMMPIFCGLDGLSALSCGSHLIKSSGTLLATVLRAVHNS